MKWLLVAIIAICNTLGDVLNTAGMKRQGELTLGQLKKAAEHSRGEEDEHQHERRGRLIRPQHQKCRYRHRDRRRQRYLDRRNVNQNWRDANPPDQQSEREPQRKNVQRLRFGDALRNQVTRQPVPYPNLARDVEKEEKP